MPQVGARTLAITSNDVAALARHVPDRMKISFGLPQAIGALCSGPFADHIAACISRGA